MRWCEQSSAASAAAGTGRRDPAGLAGEQPARVRGAQSRPVELPRRRPPSQAVLSRRIHEIAETRVRSGIAGSTCFCGARAGR